MKDTICIYGCGVYGIQTYLSLKECGIKIDCFGDRDVTKQGYVVDHLLCKSYNEILDMDKDDTLLIVAIAQGDRICTEFQNIGFKKVIYYENIMQIETIDRQKNVDIANQLDIQSLQELKKNIEDLAYQIDVPIDKKRDYTVGLLKKWEREKENEIITG